MYMFQGGSNALIKEVETLKDSKSRLLKTKAALEEENARLQKIVDRLQLTDNLYGFILLCKTILK